MINILLLLFISIPVIGLVDYIIFKKFTKCEICGNEGAKWYTFIVPTFIEVILFLAGIGIGMILFSNCVLPTESSESFVYINESQLNITLDYCYNLTYEYDIIDCYAEFIEKNIFYTKGNKFYNMEKLLNEGANCVGSSNFGKGYSRNFKNVSHGYMNFYAKDGSYGHRIYVLSGNNGYYCVFSNSKVIGCSNLDIEENQK